jgi:hypothetical protein
MASSHKQLNASLTLDALRVKPEPRDVFAIRSLGLCDRSLRVNTPYPTALPDRVGPAQRDLRHCKKKKL